MQPVLVDECPAHRVAGQHVELLLLGERVVAGTRQIEAAALAGRDEQHGVGSPLDPRHIAPAVDQGHIDPGDPEAALAIRGDLDVDVTQLGRRALGHHLGGTADIGAHQLVNRRGLGGGRAGGYEQEQEMMLGSHGACTRWSMACNVCSPGSLDCRTTRSSIVSPRGRHSSRSTANRPSVSIRKL